MSRRNEPWNRDRRRAQPPTEGGGPLASTPSDGPSQQEADAPAHERKGGRDQSAEGGHVRIVAASIPPVDEGRLLERLQALSDENRFRLLSVLRQPTTLNDIHLTSERELERLRHGRKLTRQGIQYHVDILREAELVDASLEKCEGRMMNVLQVDPTGLFLFFDELERMVCSMATLPPARERTTLELPEGDGNGASWPPEPRLRVTHGLTRGTLFSLTGKDPKASRGWVIGSSPNADVPLTFDPYVSPEHAEIMCADEGFLLLDLRSARNRTVVNGRKLRHGGEVPLRRGDVIEIGRSELVYQGPNA